jgi:acetyl esterase/lipase
MSQLLRVIYQSLALLLSGVGLFLSSWIVIPAPTFPLLILGVGAPEVSPWLLVLNAIALVLVRVNLRPSLLQRLALGASLIGLFLSVLPLVQLPATQHRMAAAMVDGLGADYMAGIPSAVQRQMRSHPFVLADVFRGINPGKCRYTGGIRFATLNGVPLNLDIYRPPLVGQYPALVVLYGGGWQNGSPSLNPGFSRYMAARGYTVFAIDYRHAPRYQFPTQLHDVRAALSFIQQHAVEYETDPTRLALLGRSAGGHLAMLAAYQPDALPVRAVVSYYGPFNLTQGYREPPNPDPLNVRAVLEAFLGGSPDELPEQYAKASPVSYVTRPLPPTLLVHGSRDHIVEVRFAKAMYQRLRAVGSTSILLEIPWAEHAFDAIFQGPSNQLALYYTERFLAWALQ